LHFGAVRREPSYLGILQVRPELGRYEALYSGSDCGIDEFELAFQPSSLAEGGNNSIDPLQCGPE